MQPKLTRLAVSFTAAFAVSAFVVGPQSLLANDNDHGRGGGSGPSHQGPQGPRGPQGPQGPAGPAGRQGAPGPVGPQGPAGPVGPVGPAGAVGPVGPVGPAGPQGAPGVDAPAAEYGVADVLVQRGAGGATVWARYSTRVGSPVGDTTGGTFRFTCREADGQCLLTLGASFLSTNGAATSQFYPRVLMQRQDLGGGAQNYCEYGDGGLAIIGAQAPSATPIATGVMINIGGSADCSGPNPAFGNVNQITVGPGYYDVFSTFVFIKQ